MGKLQLLPCVTTDAPDILSGQVAAFSKPHEPFFFVLFPETEAKEQAEKRVLDWWVGDKTARYMKVVDVDEESGASTLVSAAKWCIYEEPLTEAEMNEHLHVDWHGDADTNEWARYLIHWIHSYRLERTKGERCCVLDMMSTHPPHQGRGAGSMLVKWGTDIADSMGVRCYIEGTVVAKPLYEKHGFVACEDWVVIPVPEKWKMRPEIRYFFYERTARSGDVRT